MARVLKCDMCEKDMEKAAAKVYLSPVLPNHAMMSFQSNYSHHGDLCDECSTKMKRRFKRRQRRENNGKNKTPLKVAKSA